MAQKSFAGAAVATTLASSLLSTTTDYISVVDASGYPSSTDPFVIVIGRSTVKEEKVLIASVSGTQFTIAGSGRGYDGTTALAHDAGETVEHCIDSVTVAEANAHVNDTARDDHTQYHNSTRHTTAHASWVFGTPGNPPAVTTASDKGGSAIPAHSDHTHDIAAGAIDASNLFAAGVVDNAALAANAVTSAKITDGTIVNADVSASAAIANTKIAGLGTASTLNVPASGNAASGEVVKGNDTRLTDTRTPPDNSISTAKLQSGSVTSAKLSSSDIVPYTDVATVTPSITFNTASTSYVDFPGVGAGGPLTITFTKRLAATNLIVHVDISRLYTVTTQRTYTLALKVDSAAEVDICRGTPAVNTEGERSMTHKFTGLAAGARTITLRAKVDSAAGALQVDTTSDLAITVTETY